MLLLLWVLFGLLLVLQALGVVDLAWYIIASPVVIWGAVRVLFVVADARTDGAFSEFWKRRRRDR